jgi:hypothetical protein
LEVRAAELAAGLGLAPGHGLPGGARGPGDQALGQARGVPQAWIDRRLGRGHKPGDTAHAADTTHGPAASISTATRQATDIGPLRTDKGKARSTIPAESVDTSEHAFDLAHDEQVALAFDEWTEAWSEVRRAGDGVALAESKQSAGAGPSTRPDLTTTPEARRLRQAYTRFDAAEQQLDALGVDIAAVQQADAARPAGLSMPGGGPQLPARTVRYDLGQDSTTLRDPLATEFAQVKEPRQEQEQTLGPGPAPPTTRVPWYARGTDGVHALGDMDGRLEARYEQRLIVAQVQAHLGELLAPLSETAPNDQQQGPFGRAFTMHTDRLSAANVMTLMADAAALDSNLQSNVPPQAARARIQAQGSALIDKAVVAVAFAKALTGFGVRVGVAVETSFGDHRTPQAIEQAAAAVTVHAETVYQKMAAATGSVADVAALVAGRLDELAEGMEALFAFRVQALSRVAEVVRNAEGGIEAGVADQVLDELLATADAWYERVVVNGPRVEDRSGLHRRLEAALDNVEERLAFETLVRFGVERAVTRDAGIIGQFLEDSSALTADGVDRVAEERAGTVQAAVAAVREEMAAWRFAVEHFEAAGAELDRALAAGSQTFPARLSAETRLTEAVREAGTAFAALAADHALPETALLALAEDFRIAWVNRRSQDLGAAAHSIDIDGWLVHEATHGGRFAQAWSAGSSSISYDKPLVSNDGASVSRDAKIPRTSVEIESSAQSPADADRPPPAHGDHLVVWVNSALKRLAGTGTRTMSLADIAPYETTQSRITPGLNLPWMAERIAHAMLGHQRPRLPGGVSQRGETVDDSEEPTESSAHVQSRVAAAVEQDADTASQLTELAADADVFEETLGGGRPRAFDELHTAERVAESLDDGGSGHQVIEMEDLTRAPGSNGSPFLVPGALGDLIVAGSAEFGADEAGVWARRVLQTTHLPERSLDGLPESAQQAMRSDIESALAVLLAPRGLGSTQAEPENLAWEEKLHLGHTFVSQDRLVWLKPVLRDVRLKPALVSDTVGEEAGGAREYRVSYGSTVGEGVIAQEKRWEGATQFINVLTHNLSRLAASVVAVPLISVTGATAGKDTWAKLNIAGSKPFVQDRVAHQADLVFRVFVDGQEARYAVRDPAGAAVTKTPAAVATVRAGQTGAAISEALASVRAPVEFTGDELADMVASKHPETVVPRGLVVEYAAAFVGEQARQPLEAMGEPGMAGRERQQAEDSWIRNAELEHRRSQIPLLLNAIDITSAVADLHAALRGADVGAHVIVHMLTELKEQLSERGMRNRSRLVLGAGDVSGPIVVRGKTGGKLFDGHLRFRLTAVENGVKLHSLAKKVAIRDDLGSGTTLTRDNKFESTATLSASYNASGLRWAADPYKPNEPTVPDSVTGTAPMLAGGGESKRGGSTGEGAQTLTHTVLNAKDDLVRATATLRLEIDVVSRTHRVRPVEERVPAEIGAPLRGGRGAQFLAQDWTRQDREISESRPTWLDAGTEGEHPFVYVDHPARRPRFGNGPAGVDTAFSVATMMPGSERVERRFRTLIDARVPELTFRQKLGTPLNRTAVDNALASFFGRHALEADISEALHGIVHEIAVADRLFRLTARLHLRREAFDKVAFSSTVNQRQMTTTESTSGLESSDGFAAGFGSGFRVDLEPEGKSAEPVQSGGRIQFSASPEYAREYTSTDTFQMASSSYRRTEASGTVDEEASDAAWELSIEEVTADTPKSTVWLSRPGVVTAQVIAPPVVVRPEAESPLVASARRLDVTRPLPLVGDATSGLYAQFAQMPYLLSGVEALYRDLHGADTMPATQIPAVFTRLLSPKSLSAHFEEMSSIHGWVAGLPRRGEWNQVVQISLQVVERINERGITSDSRELEQYQAGRSMYTSARGMASSGTFAAGLSGQFRYTLHRTESQTGPQLPQTTEPASMSETGTVSGTEALTRAPAASTSPVDRRARRFVPGAFDDSIDEDFSEEESTAPGRADALTAHEELSGEEPKVPGAFPLLHADAGPGFLHRRGPTPTVVNPGGQHENAGLRNDEVLRASLNIGAGASRGWGSTHNTGIGDIHVSRVTYLDGITNADGTESPVHPTVMRGDVRIVVNLIRWRDGSKWQGNLKSAASRGEQTGADGEAAAQEEAFKSLSLSQYYDRAATVLVPDRLLERLDQGLAGLVVRAAVQAAHISEPADRLAEGARITTEHSDTLTTALDSLARVVLRMRAAAEFLARADQPSGGALRALEDSAATVSSAVSEVTRAVDQGYQTLTATSKSAHMLMLSGYSAWGADALSGLPDQVEMASGGTDRAVALASRLRDLARRTASFERASDALSERLRLAAARAREIGLRAESVVQSLAGGSADAAAAAALAFTDDVTLLHWVTLSRDLANLAARQGRLAEGMDDFPARADELISDIDDAAPATSPVTRGYHRLLPVTALHAEELDASLVFDRIIEELAEGGLLRRTPVEVSPIPHFFAETKPVVPDALYRALRSNFSSEALRNQFHSLMGSGVVGWYAVPKWEGLGARLIRVRVRAKELKPAYAHRERTDVKIMLRSQAVTQTEQASNKSRRYFGSAGGKINGGLSDIHGGGDVGGSIDIEDMTSWGQQTKDVDIYRVDPREPSLAEFGHKFDLRVEIDVAETLPAIIAAPRDLLSAAWSRTAGRVGLDSSAVSKLVAGAAEAVRAYVEPWGLSAMLSRAGTYLGMDGNGIRRHLSFAVEDQDVRLLMPTSFTVQRADESAVISWHRPHTRSYERGWAPPALSAPEAPATTAMSDLHPWDIPALYALRTWAKVAALNTAVPLLIDTVANAKRTTRLASPTPGSVAEAIYDHAVSYNTVRPRIEALLLGTYTIPVGDTVVRARLRLTDYEGFLAESNQMKVRRYNPTTTAPKNENENSFAYGLEGGIDIVGVPRSGQHLIINLPAKREWKREEKNVYEVGMTDESNRLNDASYRSFLFGSVLELEPVARPGHPSRRALHITVPGGLLASIPNEGPEELARRLRNLVGESAQTPGSKPRASAERGDLSMGDTPDAGETTASAATRDLPAVGVSLADGSRALEFLTDTAAALALDSLHVSESEAEAERVTPIDSGS